MNAVELDLALYQDKNICVACSGGGDSVALLHYLNAHAAQYGISLTAVHCEHGIRGEASCADARFVQDLCAKWGIPLFSYAQDCPALAARQKIGLEEAARNFRYHCFAEILSEGRADLIATAHHQGDEAETVLFRLCRGCSLTGAGGIRNRAGYIRPLLSVSKSEIIDYLQKNNLAYCTDESNFDERYTRNALRLEIFPALEKIIPGSSENIARFSRLAQADDELLYRLASELVNPLESGHGYAVSRSFEKPLFTRACLLALKALGVERDYTQTHLNGLYALQKGDGGVKISLPDGIIGVWEYEKLVLYRPTSQTNPAEIAFALGTFCIGDITFSVERIKGLEPGHGYVDLKKIPSTAVFRRRREGDVFRKFGGGRKKLKEYLIDCKIPVRERENMLFLADGKEILAVVGGEISENARVDETSDVGRICVLNRK